MRNCARGLHRLRLAALALGLSLVSAVDLAPAAAQSAAAAAVGPPGASSCFGCHSPRPEAGVPMPPLLGRSADGIRVAMHAFRRGEGSPTVMDRIARGFSNEEIAALAAWFARLPPNGGAP